MKDGLFEMIVCFIVGGILGFLVGLELGTSSTQKNAIAHNVAHYNPTNATFEWKTP